MKTLTQRNERGFTLIELLVVIAIIAVLAALILAALASAQKGSRDTRRKSDLNQYKVALAQYQTEHSGNYPASTLTSMTSGGEPYASLTGTYMNAFPDDPKTPGAYYYIASGTPPINFGICAQLERKPADSFAVGPTFSGERAGMTASSACVEQG